MEGIITSKLKSYDRTINQNINLDFLSNETLLTQILQKSYVFYNKKWIKKLQL